MNAVQKLRQLVSEIQRAGAGGGAAPSWELAERLLGRSSAPAAEVERACREHDVQRLDAIVAGLEGRDAAPAPAAPATGPAGSTIPEHDLAAALRAFRKRLKVSRLADESKLRGRRLTSGRESEIDAIIPPPDFPREVWEELARTGRLKHTGQGFYALP